MTTLLTDHPAWTSEPGGATARLVPDGTALWYARWDGSGLEWQTVGAAPAPAPRICRTPADDLPRRAPAALLQALSGLGTVERVANPWLWDAITAALLRRVVRAAQARRLYHRWCAAYGTRHDTPAGPLATAPGPETVLGLAGESPYREVGALFHRTALSAAAAAYLEHARDWADLAPEDLVKALQEVPGIGPWTAAAAVADHTGDYSVYPHHDLAVRTWAGAAAPGYDWPGTERGFAALWHRWAPDRPQLHALTTCTLAWGVHARTPDRHGDAPRS